MTAVTNVLSGLAEIRPWFQDLYRHLHAHPELSMAEHATADRIVAELRATPGAEDADITTGIGNTGVTAVLRNGDGPCVLIRADMDALPVREATGLAYASTATGTSPDGSTVPVMHACGHDTHITCQLAAYRLLAAKRDLWSGTLIALFQPAEEAFDGAQTMADDNLADRIPKPDVAFAQHVLPGAAGTVMVSPGAVMAGCDDIAITVHGKGGHGSAPHETVDPVVLTAAIVLRLQTIVSREVDPNSVAVITVGRMVAGTKNNIIPDAAELELTVRTYDERVRERILAAIQRVVMAEALASGAPEPDIRFFSRLPVTDNDEAVTARIREVFTSHFGADHVRPKAAEGGSEDFGIIPDLSAPPIAIGDSAPTTPRAGAKQRQPARPDQRSPTATLPISRHCSTPWTPASKPWSSRRSPGWAPRTEPRLGSGAGDHRGDATIWNEPPSESATVATRPNGVSIGPSISLPPSSWILATVASASSTEKYTRQNDGTSSGSQALASHRPAVAASPAKFVT
ncbi:MAG: amidohydrolase [Propionibacteriaceae bacterium]|nr:amidohydrolase [Propionibacteriaceae bacterium]